MNYDKLIYNTKPVKFIDYINNKYDIVHNELYADALDAYLDNFVKVTISGKCLYGMLDAFNNFITEYNDDNTQLDFENINAYIETLSTEELFHMFSLEEIESNEFIDNDYFDRLIEFILTDNSTKQVQDALDILDMSYVKKREYLLYVLFNILVMLYRLKTNINNSFNNDDFGVFNDIFSLANISDFIIRYSNSYYIINEEENELIASETELEDGGYLLIYEDMMMNNVHIGYDKDGHWVLDINESINIGRIKDQLNVMMSVTNNNLMDMILKDIKQYYIDNHKIVEIKEDEYYKASRIVIYNNNYPFNRKQVSLEPYWDKFQDYEPNNVNRIKVLNEGINDATIVDIDYVGNKAKVHSRMHDTTFYIDLDFIKEDTEIDDEFMKNTFTYKLRELYNKKNYLHNS